MKILIILFLFITTLTFAQVITGASGSWAENKSKQEIKNLNFTGHSTASSDKQGFTPPLSVRLYSEKVLLPILNKFKKIDFNCSNEANFPALTKDLFTPFDIFTKVAMKLKLKDFLSIGEEDCACKPTQKAQYLKCIAKNELFINELKQGTIENLAFEQTLISIESQDKHDSIKNGEFKQVIVDIINEIEKAEK